MPAPLKRRDEPLAELVLLKLGALSWLLRSLPVCPLTLWLTLSEATPELRSLDDSWLGCVEKHAFSLKKYEFRVLGSGGKPLCFKLVFSSMRGSVSRFCGAYSLRRLA